MLRGPALVACGVRSSGEKQLNAGVFLYVGGKPLKGGVKRLAVSLGPRGIVDARKHHRGLLCLFEFCRKALFGRSTHVRLCAFKVLGGSENHHAAVFGIKRVPEFERNLRVFGVPGSTRGVIGAPGKFRVFEALRRIHKLPPGLGIKPPLQRDFSSENRAQGISLNVARFVRGPGGRCRGKGGAHQDGGHPFAQPAGCTAGKVSKRRRHCGLGAFRYRLSDSCLLSPGA